MLFSDVYYSPQNFLFSFISWQIFRTFLFSIVVQNFSFQYMVVKFTELWCGLKTQFSQYTAKNSTNFRFH
jgi:hypothetical protein